MKTVKRMLENDPEGVTTEFIRCTEPTANLVV